MVIDTLKRLALLLVLTLAQVLVFNHIRLFGWGVPLITVYLVVTIPRGYPRWATLLWAFFAGLLVDVFANTPGVSAASMTLVGFVQPYLLEFFVPREAVANMEVSVKQMGWGKFSILSALLVTLYCLAFFSLEIFSFADWLLWTLSVVGSTLLTQVLLLAFESLRKS